MGRVSRPGPVTALFVASLLVVAAACTGDDDVDAADEIRDISETEPAESEPDAEPEPEPDPEDEPEAEDDPEPEESGDEGFTRAGVHVPADAFEINDDIDLDEDQQLFFLEHVLEAFLYTTQALNTGEWDADTLAELYAGEELDRNIAGFERYEREGLRQVNDGTIVEYVRVDVFDGGGVRAQLCTTDGPEDGVIDLESGDYTFRDDNPHRLLAIDLALVDVGGGVADYRIVRIGGTSDGDCPR